MDELTIPTPTTDPTEQIEAARVDHPELVAEFERLRHWCAICLGEEVAAWKGREV